MNKAIGTYQPISSWLSIGLLALLVLGFGLYADNRVVDHTSASFVTENTLPCHVVTDGCNKTKEDKSQDANTTLTTQ